MSERGGVRWLEEDLGLRTMRESSARAPETDHPVLKNTTDDSLGGDTETDAQGCKAAEHAEHHWMVVRWWCGGGLLM